MRPLVNPNTRFSSPNPQHLPKIENKNRLPAVRYHGTASPRNDTQMTNNNIRNPNPSLINQLPATPNRTVVVGSHKSTGYKPLRIVYGPNLGYTWYNGI